MKKGTSKYASIGKAKIDFGDFYLIQRLGGSLADATVRRVISTDWIVAKTGESMNVTKKTREVLSKAIAKVFEDLF